MLENVQEQTTGTTLDTVIGINMKDLTQKYDVVLAQKFCGNRFNENNSFTKAFLEMQQTTVVGKCYSH